MVEQLLAVCFVMFVENAEHSHQILLEVEGNVKVTGKSDTSPVQINSKPPPV